MKEDFHLTNNEYKLMKILWNSDRPLAKYEILVSAKGHNWSDNYLKKMLTVLLNKGTIRPEGKVQVVKNYSRLYVPTMTEDEYNISRYPVNSIKTIAGLVDEVYESTDEKERLISQLEQIVQELKEKKQ